MRDKSNLRFDARSGALGSKSHLPQDLQQRILTVGENIETPSFVRAVLLALASCADAAAPAVSLYELQFFLKVRHKLWLSERTIKAAVSILVNKYDLQIGSSRERGHHGYFFIVTESQREAAVKPLHAQAVKMLQRCAQLSPCRSYFRRLLGQMEVGL